MDLIVWIDGESLLGVDYKATPVLISGGTIDINMIHALFTENGSHLPSAIADFISDKLMAFSS